MIWQIGSARIDESGRISGGKPGDQTGGEICTRSYYNSPWDCVLGLTEAEATLTLPEISMGDEGEAVRSMQGLLILRGYYCGCYGADGEFGSMTRLALADFQLDNDLEPDAVCGKLTWGRLICA